MNYKFIVAIFFNALLLSNLASAMERDGQQIIGEDPEPWVETPISNESKERLEKFNNGINYICKKITKKNMAIIAAMNVSGITCASYCFNNLGCSNEAAMIAGWIASIGTVALSQCIAPGNNPDYFANVLKQCSSTAITFISYLGAEQCGFSSISAAVPALVTGVGFHYACTPAIRKYCYELHPKAKKRIEEIDQELKKLDVEVEEIEKKIKKRSDVKTTGAGKMRLNKIGETPITIAKLKIKLEKLKEETAALAQEKAKLEQQRISKIDKAIRKYFSDDNNAAVPDNNFVEAVIATKPSNDDHVKKIKNKTRGLPYKNGPEIKSHVDSSNAVDDVDENSLVITERLKRDLIKANIKDLYKHQIKLDDLIKILKLVGYDNYGHTGSHQQFGGDNHKRLPLVAHDDTQKAHHYQRQEVQSRLEDLGITEDIVKSWYQNW